MVVDEYGGVLGLVIIEDVIEQIVGDIDDEYDVEDDIVICCDGDCQFMVRVLAFIEDFNWYFGIVFFDEEFDIIGGLILQEFGWLLCCGESIFIGQIEFCVLRVDRCCIDMLWVMMFIDIQLLDELVA